MYTDKSDYFIDLGINQKLNYAIQVKRINDELLEHLSSSIIWLLRYSQSNGIDLPNKEQIFLLINRAIEIASKLPSGEPTYFQQPNKTPSDSTESYFRLCFLSRLLIYFQGPQMQSLLHLFF